MSTLITPVAHAAAGLIGLGSYRPERIVTNDEVAVRIESSDEWIRERSGIIERRYATAEETAASMGAVAGARAIKDAGLEPTDIDVVMVATFTHRFQTPSAAAEVSHLVGATNASAFDISAACAGFCYGLAIADSLIRAGSATHILVVGTEKLSDFLNPDDRGTAFIFADGAGAVVVSATTTQGISPTVWGADGSAMDAIIMEPDSVQAGITHEPSLITMQGQRVFRWAVGSMGDVCKDALAKSGLQASDLKAFVPHQANLRITSAIVKHLDLPESVIIAKDIEYTGNTSAASIPLALDALRSSGQIKSGDPVLLVGFGAGLTYAAQVALTP
ncbi:MAG: beta-ketoacyl-ACP synthase III [Actinomycetes bacterium]